MISLTKLNRPRVILFSILALLSAFVLTQITISYFDTTADNSRLKAMSLILVPHGILGMIALVVGPFQFSTTLRKNNIGLHKRLGKIYIFSILLSMPFAILLNIYHTIPGAKVTFIFENICQALVWGITASMAWRAAARRQITIHKMWAARSYGITMVFVLSRIYNPMKLFMKNSDINDFTHFLWFMIVFGLVIPDILVFGKELFASRKVSATRSTE